MLKTKRHHVRLIFLPPSSGGANSLWVASATFYRGVIWISYQLKIDLSRGSKKGTLLLPLCTVYCSTVPPQGLVG